VALRAVCVALVDFAGGLMCGIVDARAVAGQVLAACGPEAIKHAAVLGPVKAKPFGWPRRRGQP